MWLVLLFHKLNLHENVQYVLCNLRFIDYTVKQSFRSQFTVQYYSPPYQRVLNILNSFHFEVYVSVSLVTRWLCSHVAHGACNHSEILGKEKSRCGKKVYKQPRWS